MDIDLRDELKTLIQNSRGPCVSVFMPTHRSGPETQQDPIRLKNLLGEAEERLVSAGIRRPEALELLKPAGALVNDVFYLRRQSDGLAVFISPEVFRSLRLPVTFDEQLIVGDRFHLKPLLPLLSGDGRFYVLALSQDKLRMFQCSRLSIDEVELKDVPRSIGEALKFDDPQKQLQYHASTVGTRPGGSLVFHGHAPSDPKKDILRYLQMVNNGLHGILKEEDAPLVLAGVDYLLPIYREANSYAHLYPEAVTGNPDGLNPKELHEQAWAVVQPHFQRAQEGAFARYGELAAKGLASNDIHEVAPAASFGRVDSLFVAVGMQRWGTFDPSTGVVQVHETQEAGDEDLLDLAAIHTFLNRGAVYAVEPAKVPGGDLVAALFRY